MSGSKQAFSLLVWLLCGVLGACSLIGSRYSDAPELEASGEGARAQPSEAAREFLVVPPLPFPYGQVSVRIDGGPPGRMLLAREEAGVQQWTATDGTAIWMRDARVVATRGLPTDLVEHQLLSSPPDLVRVATGRLAGADLAVYARSAEAEIGRVLVSQFLRVGEPEQVAIAEQVRPLQRVEERVYHRASGQRQVNVFWVDRISGRIRRIEQHVPGTEHHIEVTWLPAASGDR